MPRKSGCPFSIRNWQVEVENRAQANTWIKVKGLTTMNDNRTADTEDGSSADSGWGEPYVSKRNGTIDLEGKPVTDSVTGAPDPGQAELDYFATLTGCDADMKMRITDPYGHSVIVDAQVTDNARSSDESGQTRSWSLAIVGEPTEVPYVQVDGVTITAAGTAVTNSSVIVGQTKALAAKITPVGASNQKISVASADSTKVRITNVDGSNFDIVGVSATATPVNVKVTTMNNGKTASVAITVTAT